MQLHVLLNEITVKLIELRVSKKSSQTNSDPIEKLDFSLFRISQVDFKYLKHSTGFWKAFFNMRALRLKDTRPDSNLAEKEMLMPLDASKDFINLVYQTTPDGHSKLRFDIDHLKINLCLPYILKLYQIAMEAVSSPAKTTVKKAAVEKTRAVANVPQEASNSSLRVDAKIRLPEVFLFAEPERSDSKILNMKAEINMRFSSKEGNDKLRIEGTVGMRLGEYDNAAKQGITFLSPCKFRLEMVQKKGYVLAYYQLKIDSLIFNMTPTLYQVRFFLFMMTNQWVGNMVCVS